MAILKPHPYLHIKKIPIHAWTLRRQIESLIKKHLEDLPEDADIKLKDYKEIVKLFNEEWVLREYFDLPQFKNETKVSLSEETPPPPEGEETPPAKEKTDNQDNKKNLQLYEKLSRVRPDQELIGTGHTFLNDLDIFSVNFFSSIPFLIGQSILIQFEVPRHFVMSGEVIRCYDYNMATKVISDIRPEYRIQAKFTFKRVGERTLLRNFLESIHRDEPIKGRAKKVESSDDGDDDGPTADDIAALGL